MGCEWGNDHLLDYIDGERDPSQKLILKAHLHVCETCSHEYEKILNAWKALDSWEEVPPPVHLQKHILRSLTRRRVVKWLNVMLPVAAVLLIVIGITLFYRGNATKNAYELASVNKAASVQTGTDITEENENDIIANLQLLREKEFYDSLDRLEKIDYLPLVEEPGSEDKKDQRSSLELLAG